MLCGRKTENKPARFLKGAEWKADTKVSAFFHPQTDFLLCFLRYFPGMLSPLRWFCISEEIPFCGHIFKCRKPAEERNWKDERFRPAMTLSCRLFSDSSIISGNTVLPGSRMQSFRNFWKPAFFVSEKIPIIRLQKKESVIWLPGFQLFPRYRQH